jgi:hypothetical protein
MDRRGTPANRDSWLDVILWVVAIASLTPLIMHWAEYFAEAYRSIE